MKKLVTLAMFGLSINTFAQHIAAGWEFSLSLCNTTTTVRVCGYNYYGVMGDGTSSTYNYVPTVISSFADISAVAARQNHALALKNDGTVWAWGSDFSGECGNGLSDIDMHTPVQVTAMTGVIAVAAGGNHSMAIKNDGTVWVWGQGSVGQLGNGLNTDTSLAVNLSSLTGAIAIAGGDSHSLVVKNDSTLWSFGYNGYGQLGTGNTTNSNVPVQVSSLTGVVAIAGGYMHSLALKSDGTVWAFGDNAYGQLGDGTTTASNVPVQVSALTGVIAIAAGQRHSLALKSDGTVWAWGEGSRGQLGDGTGAAHLVPHHITSLSGITEIAAGNWHSLALKNNGTLWGWGSNDYGSLGTGDDLGGLTPIQMLGGACANCFAHYSTTYSAALNNFTLTVDSTTASQAVGYHWDFGDGSSSTVSFPTHAYAIDSIYNICMKIYTASGDSCTFCHFVGIDSLGNIIRNGGFTVNMQNPYSPTGISQLSNPQAGMVIHPNPFNFQSTITFSEFQKNSVIKIADVLGNEIKMIRFTGNELVIEKGTMKAGIYFVSVMDEKGNVLKKKIVIADY